MSFGIEKIPNLFCLPQYANPYTKLWIQRSAKRSTYISEIGIGKEIEIRTSKARKKKQELLS